MLNLKENIQLKIEALVDDKNDKIILEKALTQIVNNLNKENLLLIAEKSNRKGINQKIQSYKSFL